LPDILIRDVDPEVRRLLEERAIGNGTSVSVEIRAILEAAVAEQAPAPDVGAWLFDIPESERLTEGEAERLRLGLDRGAWERSERDDRRTGTVGS